MNAETNKVERVIGFDCHPDTFTAAIIQGPTPAAAIVQKTFNKLPLSQLPGWAEKNTTPQDLFVLEASGNSFHVVRVLAKVNRQALVLESCHLGKLKEAHANNDRISAVRIGKAYLAGTARVVWLPDLKTQERRDLFHIHRKAVKRTTQLRNRLQSYLSDNGVRLRKGTQLRHRSIHNRLCQTRASSASQREPYLSPRRRRRSQYRGEWAGSNHPLSLTFHLLRATRPRPLPPRPPPEPRKWFFGIGPGNGRERSQGVGQLS
jgi:transposase